MYMETWKTSTIWKCFPCPARHTALTFQCCCRCLTADALGWGLTPVHQAQTLLSPPRHWAMLPLASSAAEGAWTLQHSTTDTTRPWLRHAGARHTRFTARAAVGPGNARRADGSSCQGGVHVRQSRAFSRILIILCSYMWGGPMNCEFGCDFQLNNGLVFRYRFNFWSRNAWLHVCVFAEESFSVCPVHFCIAYRNKNRE